jgi:hypothetical protein
LKQATLVKTVDPLDRNDVARRISRSDYFGLVQIVVRFGQGIVPKVLNMSYAAIYLLRASPRKRRRRCRRKQLVKIFAMDFSSSDTAKPVGVNNQSINPSFFKIHCRIARYCDNQSPYSGEVKAMNLLSDPNEFQAKEVVVLMEKLLFLMFANVIAKSSQRSS